jgi:hypothetical protein
VRVVSGVRNGCTILPENASTAIREVIANRETVLAQAQALRPPTTRTASVKSELVTALQASIEANYAYANWMDYLYREYFYAPPIGCPAGGPPTDTHYDDATAASGRATAAKQSFTVIYNPLAARSGLRQWRDTEF